MLRLSLLKTLSSFFFSDPAARFVTLLPQLLSDSPGPLPSPPRVKDLRLCTIFPSLDAKSLLSASHSPSCCSFFHCCILEKKTPDASFAFCPSSRSSSPSSQPEPREVLRVAPFTLHGPCSQPLSPSPATVLSPESPVLAFNVSATSLNIFFFFQFFVLPFRILLGTLQSLLP